MAKKQTFESKLKKDSGIQHKMVKVVFPYKSNKTNAWRFAEKMVKVPLDADEAKYIDDTVKNGVAFLESNS